MKIMCRKIEGKIQERSCDTKMCPASCIFPDKGEDITIRFAYERNDEDKRGIVGSINIESKRFPARHPDTKRKLKTFFKEKIGNKKIVAFDVDTKTLYIAD